MRSRLKLPLPPGEGWGEGRATRTQPEGSRRFGRRLAFALLAGLLPLWIGLSPARSETSDEANGRRIMQEAAISLLPHVSTDTTPIEISYFGYKLRVPRNYLVSLANWDGKEQDWVGFRVMVPSLSPITRDNLACFQNDPRARPPRCEPLSFHLRGTKDGPDSETQLGRLRPLFRNKTPLPGPDGWDRYEFGDGGVFTTVIGGRRLVYECNRSTIEPEHSLCTPVGDRTERGLWLFYFLPFRLLPQAVTIDTELRRLVDSFIISK